MCELQALKTPKIISDTESTLFEEFELVSHSPKGSDYVYYTHTHSLSAPE